MKHFKLNSLFLFFLNFISELCFCTLMSSSSDMHAERAAGVVSMERVWEMMECERELLSTHACKWKHIPAAWKEKLFCASQARPPRGWKDWIKDFYHFFFSLCALVRLSPDSAYLGKTGRRQWDSRCVFCAVSIVISKFNFILKWCRHFALQLPFLTLLLCFCSSRPCGFLFKVLAFLTRPLSPAPAASPRFPSWSVY